MALLIPESELDQGARRFSMFELFVKKKLLVFSALIILFIFAFGFLGTIYVFTNPNQIYRTIPAWDPADNEFCSNTTNQKIYFDRCYMQIGKYDQPSASHLLGLDEKGRDVLSRLAWGVRHSLEIGIVASILITLLAIFFGAIGAYSGGFIDDIFQFIVNLFIVIPVIPVLIYISYLTQQSGLIIDITTPKLFIIPTMTLLNMTLKGHLLIAVIIAFTNWGWAARSIRSQVLSLKERNFINMARVSGLNRISISLYEILPNMLSYISLVFVISIGISIASEAGLSVLGIGVPASFTTLGTLLFWARTLLQPTNWAIGLHVFLPPGIVITVLFVFLYVLQAEMDDIFNPRLRKG